MAGQIATGFPKEMMEQKKKELQMEQLEMKKSQIQANPEIPEWRKKMLIQQIELTKKQISLSNKQQEIQDMESIGGGTTSGTT